MLNPVSAHSSPTEAPLLQAIGITKFFGNFVANDPIDLDLYPRQIHALLGENGAGKSTLVKIIYGALQPSAGEIRWKGKTTAIPNPAAARRLGIGMVFQHFSLVRCAHRHGKYRAGAAKGNAQGAGGNDRAGFRRLRPAAAPDALVADLSVGERQRIEIVRCLLQSPQLLIMDEPTSVLTPQEADYLFVTLQRLAREGCAVLYISHRLEEVKRICHHATIMRRGKVVAETDPREGNGGDARAH